MAHYISYNPLDYAFYRISLLIVELISVVNKFPISDGEKFALGLSFYCLFGLLSQESKLSK